MRILNICAYTWSIGGPPKIIYDHTKVAIAQGHQVDILSPFSPGDELYPVPEGARVIPCRRNPPVSNYFKEFSVDLYRYLKQHIHEYDIIHCHGIWHFGSVAPFLIDHKVPKVITIHGLLDRWTYRLGYVKKQLMSFILQKRLVERADLVQINNTDEEQDLLRYLGHRHPNVAIIPNGIPLRDFEVLPSKGSFRQQYGIPADKKMVLFMSRLNRKKGLDLLLPAFHRYTQEFEDAVLVLAGPDDGYQETTDTYISEHGLQGKMVRVGMLTGETKKAALADADIFVLPSYSEGFSMAVLETMAAGLPALLSDRVGFGETIRQHQAAYLTELNEDSVLDGLKTLLHNDVYRSQLRQNALKLVREQYDINVVASQLLNEYQKILRR